MIKIISLSFKTNIGRYLTEFLTKIFAPLFQSGFEMLSKYRVWIRLTSHTGFFHVKEISLSY